MCVCLAKLWSVTQRLNLSRHWHCSLTACPLQGPGLGGGLIPWHGRGSYTTAPDTKTWALPGDVEMLETCPALCQRGPPLRYITFICGRFVSECKAYDSSLFSTRQQWRWVSKKRRSRASSTSTCWILRRRHRFPLLSWQLRWPETGPKVARAADVRQSHKFPKTQKRTVWKFAEGTVWYFVNELIHIPSNIYKKACIDLLCSSATCDATTRSSFAQHKGWKWLRPLSKHHLNNHQCYSSIEFVLLWGFTCIGILESRCQCM